MDKGLVGLWYGWRVVIGNGDDDGCSGWLMVFYSLGLGWLIAAVTVDGGNDIERKMTGSNTLKMCKNELFLRCRLNRGKKTEG